jgi:asparagine synthase (glutamine-hydrolysing)
MSGITGRFNLDGRPAERGEISRMVDALAHRGPDGSGVWCMGPAGLGHQLLRAGPDVPGRPWPRIGAGGSAVLTADARIDNRDELIRLLNLGGTPAAEVTDADLILGSYERWGDRCAERLLGDFAFAIWDVRRQRLFCARDHFGIKPFYYHHRPDRLFAFGSEIKPLLACPDVPRRLNETKVGDFLGWAGEDREITFYEGVYRLPAAHTLSISPGGITLHQYWSLDPEREIRYSSDEQYVEAFRELFMDAVRCRIPEGFGVGSTLSGGLDSSAVACAARDILAEREALPLRTFSLRFPGTPHSDEGAYIDSVLQQDGFVPHAVNANDFGAIGALAPHLNQLDEPPYAHTIGLQFALLSAARSLNTRVMLDGMFGDSTISHARWVLPELARKGKIIALGRAVLQRARVMEQAPWWILKRHALRPLASPRQLKLWQQLRGREERPAGRRSVLNAALVERHDLKQRHQRMRARYLLQKPTERAAHRLEISSGTFQRTAELLDSVAALMQVEVRYPFSDRRLIEFCLAMPGEQKIHGGWSRSILRRGMAESLPPLVRDRTDKADLSHWILNALSGVDQERLAELMARVRGGSDTICAFLDEDAMDESYRRFVEMVDMRNANLLWQPLVLSEWIGKHPERFSHGPSTKGGESRHLDAVPTLAAPHATA